MSLTRRAILAQILLMEAGFAYVGWSIGSSTGIPLPLDFSLSSVVLGIFFGFALFGSFLIPLRRLQRWNEAIYEMLRVNAWSTFAPLGPSGWVIVSIAAGIGEELFFRGFLQGSLSRALGPWGGLVVASLIFGLAHWIHWLYFVVSAYAGLVLGLVYLGTGNLFIPMVAHAVYDVLAFFRAARLLGRTTSMDPLDSSTAPVVSSNMD